MTSLVMADVFGGLDALAPKGRSKLARALRCPAAGLEGSPLGDLTDGRYRQRLVGAVVSAVADDSVVSRLTARTLAELAPAAQPDGELAEALCPARLVFPLRRYASLGWSSILALRVGDVQEWPGLGPCAVADLVGVAVRRGVDGLADRHRRGADNRALADLGLLLGAGSPGGPSPLGSALVTLAGRGNPPAVRAAASRLLQAAEQAAGGSAPGRALARALDEVLDAAGDVRDRAIFEAWELSAAERPTLDVLARRLRLSKERLRQLRIRAADRARAAGDGGPHSLTSATVEIRARLGAATSLGDAAVLLAEVVAESPDRTGAAGPEVSTTAGRLLLWLAGPYRPVRGAPGWISTDPEGLATATRQLLEEDGGARLTAAVREELAALGVAESRRDAWLEACGGRLVDDMVVSTTGSTGDLLERLLFATGTPTTVADLAARLPGADRGVRSVLRRDPRFVGWDDEAGTVGLAEWSEVPAAPMSGPRRRPEAAPAAAAGALPAIDGRYWLRLAVDEAVLAGQSRAAPAELAVAVGVAPDHRRVFAGRFGPVSLVHDADGLRLASLRPVAMACGASPGDVLVLGFAPDGQLTVKLHPAGAPAPIEADHLAQGGS